MHESGCSSVNQVGFVMGYGDSTVQAVAANNGMDVQTVVLRKSGYTYYQLNNSACPIIGYRWLLRHVVGLYR